MKDTLQHWLEEDPDPQTRAEVENILKNNDDVSYQERFSQRLQFGTAGLRGLMGAGTNRINRLVVRQTITGLACYLRQHWPKICQKGVCIGFDGRKLSAIFAEDCARILGQFHIKSYLESKPCSTPHLAFAVKQTPGSCGLMITASHNPPQYNGIKFYWQEGIQVTPPTDEQIQQSILQQLSNSTKILPSLEMLQTQGLVQRSPEDLGDRYLQDIVENPWRKHGPKNQACKPVAFAYSALHGVGFAYAQQLTQKLGHTIYSVKAQEEADPTFPTLENPNPEEPLAMQGVIALARAHGLSSACASDPDADRLGIAVYHEKEGDFRLLKGDEIGALLGCYLLEQQHALNPKKQPICVGTTFVSSRLLKHMAKAHDAYYIETLTGFKWLWREALRAQNMGYQPCFFYEEALGFAIGDTVRDKDGIAALGCWLDLQAWLLAHNSNVWQQLAQIYQRYGLFVTKQQTKKLTTSQQAQLSWRLRQQAPQAFAGRKIKNIWDLSDLHTAEHLFKVPQSNLLLYELEDDSRIIVRPSGTEPKLKCYYQYQEITISQTPENAEIEAQKVLQSIQQDHSKWLDGLLF